MTVTYRDETGVVCVILDDDGVTFLDGKAYFSDGDREYVIPVSELIAVEKEKF